MSCEGFALLATRARLLRKVVESHFALKNNEQIRAQNFLIFRHDVFRLERRKILKELNQNAMKYFETLGVEVKLEKGAIRILTTGTADFNRLAKALSVKKPPIKLTIDFWKARQHDSVGLWDNKTRTVTLAISGDLLEGRISGTIFHELTHVHTSQRRIRGKPSAFDVQILAPKLEDGPYLDYQGGDEPPANLAQIKAVFAREYSFDPLLSAYYATGKLRPPAHLRLEDLAASGIPERIKLANYFARRNIAVARIFTKQLDSLPIKQRKGEDPGIRNVEVRTNITYLGQTQLFKLQIPVKEPLPADQGLVDVVRERLRRFHHESLRVEQLTSALNTKLSELENLSPPEKQIWTWERLGDLPEMRALFAYREAEWTADLSVQSSAEILADDQIFLPQLYGRHPW